VGSSEDNGASSPVSDTSDSVSLADSALASQLDVFCNKAELNRQCQMPLRDISYNITFYTSILTYEIR